MSGRRVGRRFIAVAATVVVASVLPSVLMATPASAQLPPSGSAKTWYFAEGNTLPNWFEFIEIINPDPNNDISVHVDYQIEEPAGHPLPSKSQDLPILAGQRATIPVYDVVGRTFTGVAAKLASTANFVAERPMYFINPFDVGEINGAHDALGVNASSKTWYFAEGSTLVDPAPGVTTPTP